MALRRSLAAAGPAISRVSRRLSLRARLLLGLLAVATVGLLVADFAVYGQIGAYLNNQARGQLVSGADISARLLGRQALNQAGDRLPLDIAVEVVSPNGTVLVSDPVNFRIEESGKALANRVVGTIFTAGGSGGSTGGGSQPYLVLAQSMSVCVNQPVCFSAVAQPVVVLFAIPDAPLQATLARLLAVELLVSLCVLVVIGFLGYLVVRLGLRPLTDIEETAGKIAAGDLSRRVSREDETTEVGRLGGALNAMLGTIEQSFEVRRASEERLRRFLADASHELRTPVTSIRGYAELFRRGAASRPEDLALAMRRIEEEASRMGLLVEDLLLLARLDQGRPLEREPVDLAALAIDACADAQVLAPDRDLSVDAPFPVTVVGDEQRLRQVVGNLVQNALRHTPEEAAITVSVSAIGGQARLSVRDEGPGLEPEQAARVFERFYRADPSRARGSGGTGLGLSIVASIAAAHGGRARVETVPGRGANFIVELPLASVSVAGGSGSSGAGGGSGASGVTDRPPTSATLATGGAGAGGSAGGEAGAGKKTALAPDGAAPTF